PPHKRFHWEFYAVISGRLAPSLPHRSTCGLVSDTLWCFAPDCEHGWQGEPHHSCEVVVFHFSSIPPDLQTLTGADGMAAVRLRPADKLQLRRLAAGLLPYFQQSSVVGSLLGERAVLDLTLLMLQRPPSSVPAGTFEFLRPAPVSSGPDEARVLAAEKWFQAHLNEQPTADQVARGTGISAAHLRRLFRSVRGRSPRDVFNRLRLDRAMQLLAQSDLKLSGVAAECGFASTSHFCQAFKKWVGTTPTIWRRLVYLQYRHPEAQPMTPAEVRRELRLLPDSEQEADPTVRVITPLSECRGSDRVHRHTRGA
ncbi:MAG TPA: AraC family transcriptional regulator, partial [Candidatus Synoicihabitans sp.]|nr:AraC family transcriptional regulator [Candidatus Synoicihabitans sp.]